MASALITSRTYEPTYGFLGTKTNYLVGNVGDSIHCEINVEIETTSESSTSNPYTVTGNDTITRNTGSFYNDALVVGSTVTVAAFQDGGNPVNVTATILTVTPTTIVLNVTGGTLINGTYPSFSPVNTNMLITATSGMQSVDFAMALIENSNISSGSVNSLIDGSTANFSNNQLASLGIGSTANMIAQGQQSGQEMSDVKVTYVGLSGAVHEYKIEYDFVITPVWDTLNDLSTETSPSFFDNTE